MTVDSLYREVTEAILHAETLTPGTLEAAQALRDVSVLEEQIAERFAASHAEGAIARRGAVRAAVAAGDGERARRLVALYVGEADAPAELCEAIRGLYEPADRVRAGSDASRGPTTIEAVLTALRLSATSNRDLGDRFERLMRAYLTTDPLYVARFEDVWLWQQWPGRENAPDTGVDLVAQERGGGICAIQCKFYDPEHRLDKTDIDSFFTASGKAPFTSRMIITTTDRWTKHAEAALERQHVAGLASARSRSRRQPHRLEQVRPERARRPGDDAKKSLYPHQQAALKAVIAGLDEQDRGKLIMACGTGKTFTSLRIAERFAAGRAGERPAHVLFLVPSMSLLSQTLREWTAETRTSMTRLAVCSDVRVGRHTEDISPHDLPFPATTDAAKLLDADRQHGRVVGGHERHDGGVLDLPVDCSHPRGAEGRTAHRSTSSSATRRTARPASRSPARMSRTSCKVHDAEVHRREPSGST